MIVENSIFFTILSQLIPLYVCTGVGAAGAVYYLLRLAIRNPDVTWSRAQNPEPNQEYRDKQYKVCLPHMNENCPKKFLKSKTVSQFYSPIRDYSKLESPAPKYEK